VFLVLLLGQACKVGIHSLADEPSDFKGRQPVNVTLCNADAICVCLAYQSEIRKIYLHRYFDAAMADTALPLTT
jgi:hypothetical protein